MFSQARPAIFVTLFFTLLLGVGYPLVVTAIARLVFPIQAEGSLIRGHDGQVIGSALIAQGFTSPRYLHPRPSAAGASGYDASASSGSNLGPMNPALIERVAKDAVSLKSDGAGVIAADALTTSGSGLDPDVSPANAMRQASRIAKSRGVSQSQVQKVIAANTQGPWLGIFGQPHVNVLKTNLALDAAMPAAYP